MRIPQDGLAIYSNNPKLSGLRKLKLFMKSFEIVELQSGLVRQEYLLAPVGRPEQS